MAVVMRVQNNEPVQGRIAEETESRDRKDRRWIMSAKLQRLGQKVEEGKTDNSPGAESQDHVKLVAKAQRQSTSGKSGAERGGRKGQNQELWHRPGS